jgi:hypothetical protein
MMKRTIGWFIAVMMAAPACAQQPQARPAPPPAPKAMTQTMTGHVRVFGTGDPGQVRVEMIDGPTTQPMTMSGGTLYLAGDGSKLTIVSAEEEAAANQIRSLEGYLSAVGQYSHSNRDATTTAIAAVMQAAEILKSKGADAQISYFTKVLDKTENENVKRAIRLQLIDAFKRAGQTDKALDELKTIILDAPASAR